MKRKRYTKEFKAKVALEAIKSQKTVNEIASEFGVHVSQINEWKRQLLAGLPEVFDRKSERREVANEAKKDRLYRQIGKLQVEVDWLKKKDRTSRMSVQEKRECIDAGHPQLSIARQCELIGLPRASYYREITLSESQENLELMRLIDEEYTRHPFYGSRKMRAYLHRRRPSGEPQAGPAPDAQDGTGLDCPQAQYQPQGPPSTRCIPICSGIWRSTRPNQVWCSDLTYIPLEGGFAYMTVVMDWYSRYVLSWEISVTMEEHFCVNALGECLAALHTSRDFQHRPGLTVYRQGLHRDAQGPRYPHQHGWQGTGHGQHHGRALVALGEVRGSLSQGVSQCCRAH